jgi:hypothetical protein
MIKASDSQSNGSHAVRFDNLPGVCWLVVSKSATLDIILQVVEDKGKVFIDENPARVYNIPTIEYWSGCLFPRKGRPNGEAGASPALSRNCELAGTLTSQAARPGRFYTLSWKGGGNGQTDCLFPLPCLRTGDFVWEIIKTTINTRGREAVPYW